MFCVCSDKELKVIEYLPEKREGRCKSVQSIRWNVWRINKQRNPYGIKQGTEQGIELNQFEVYQIMLDKGFSVKVIASIFSVSEESIKKLLMKA